MLNMLTQLVLTGLALVVATTQIHADPIRGSEDPGFQSALNIWLDGNDEKAIRALAVLARDNNRAAQIFLGQVQDKVWLHDHVTGKLNRKQKIELLREPKGLSGRSWLQSAAHDTPLARHLLEVRKPYENAEIGKALVAMGEVDAALQVMVTAIVAGDRLGALEIAIDDHAIVYTLGVARGLAEDPAARFRSGWYEANDPRIPRFRRRMHLLPTEQDAEKILWGAVSFRNMQPGSEEFQYIGEVLLALPELKPLVQIIERHCPGDVSGALASLQISRWSRPLTLEMFSPVESILPTKTYRASKRFENDVLRKMGRARFREAYLQNLNACAFSMLPKSSSQP